MTTAKILTKSFQAFNETVYGIGDNKGNEKSIKSIFLSLLWFMKRALTKFHALTTSDAQVI